MQMQQALTERIHGGLAVEHFEILNESDNHSGPPGRESHFKVVVVSPAFEGQSLVKRHQAVYALVREQLAGGVHALALHTYTPAEWEKLRVAPDSPFCRGGSKKH